MGERLIVTATPVDEAARLVVAAIQESIAEKSGARFAVAGGSAARALGVVVNALPADVWSRVALTWVDERRVPLDSPHSNRGDAYRHGWLSKDRPAGFELPLWLDDETPERATKRVRIALEDKFASRLDVTLLGIGEDGHIASLFPGHLARFAKGPVALVEDSPKPPPQRITLTYEILRKSKAHVLLAMGESKRAALTALLSGDPLAPANALPDLTIVTDLDVKGLA